MLNDNDNKEINDYLRDLNFSVSEKKKKDITQYTLPHCDKDG